MRVVAMLPTYNEAGSIRACIEQILALPVEAGVVVADDQSPDGTGQIADQLAAEHPGRVFVLHRTGPRGRGVAGIDGFQFCVQLPVDYVVEMDADLQHDPADIPRLVAAADRTGAEIVVGSRYVPGGGEVNRGLTRRIVSRLANTYLRLTLGLSLRDCSSGYRLFRRDALAALDLATMSASGPWILQEVLWRAKQRNYRIVEIPIRFQERTAGESKLNLAILLRSLITPFVLRRSAPLGERA
ncbi:MAG: polyprenol monophosphomannose synthase [Chloroflexota bacterium]|nr:polyprenol monophosphomannose synthase [Dehalococcoidia bacterium]MDW8253746.1 polyprenol monophosphomannose synthase [Chloroflexota bacterium]